MQGTNVTDNLTELTEKSVQDTDLTNNPTEVTENIVQNKQ